MKGQMGIDECIEVAENEDAMLLDSLRKAALRFVNDRRKEAGLRATSRLSKGYKGDALLNPVAQSLEKVGAFQAMQSGSSVWLASTTYQWRRFYEPHTARFMREFDQGQYPELEVPSTTIKIKGKVVG